LRKELEKSSRGELTPPCEEDCNERCGVCNEQLAVSSEQCLRTKTRLPTPDSPLPIKKPDLEIWRLLFCFSKEGSAVFHGHLSLVEIFSMALCRAGLDVQYTQGFNPLAKLEIVSPLSVGINAGGEIAAVEFLHAIHPNEFLEKMNATLPEGLKITQAECYCIPSGSKKHSLSSLLWGFGYAGRDGETEYVPAAAEKAHREKHLSSGQTLFSLRRSCVLAKNLIDGNQPWASYFDVYGHLYREWGVGSRE
jgi:hypothetical protein